MLDEGVDHLVADPPSKIRFEVVAAATDERFVEQRLDFAVGRRSDLVRQRWNQCPERSNDLFARFMAAIIADRDGRDRIAIGRGEQRAQRVYLVRNGAGKVAIERQRLFRLGERV